LFSCFTGTTSKTHEDTVAEAMTAYGAKPSRNDSLIQLEQLLQEKFRHEIQYYQQEELHRHMDTGIRYEEYAQPLLAQVLAEWCGCETEEDCQWVLQQKMPENVSTGDFNKAVLKIIAMAKQMETTLGQLPVGNHEWLEIISAMAKVEGMLAKYVITCQSLYV
jgi:hypothetical protein